MTFAPPLTRPVEFDKVVTKIRSSLASPAQAVWKHGYIPLFKYDGVCGIAHYDGETWAMYSRTGEDYTKPCQDILADLHVPRHLRGKPIWLFGEVWAPRTPQSVISGAFRSTTSGHNLPLYYILWDMVTPGYGGTRNYRTRRADYMQYAAQAGARVGAAMAPFVGLYEDPVEVARGLPVGYDGLVLWNPEAIPLENKKATDGGAIKVKPTITRDLEVVATLPGKGKHAGVIGSLVVQGSGQLRGAVGTGLSDSDRAAGADYWIGKIIEVEAMGLTADGQLREPRFVRIRFDKTETD